MRKLLVLTLMPLGWAQPVVKITGEHHKLALFADGTVGGWGSMRDGQLGPRAAIPNVSFHAKAFVPIALPARARDVAAGERSSYVLLEDGTVLAFGWGMDGQLGCGPACAQGSELPVPVTGLREVTALTACEGRAFALHRDGTVSAWGVGAAGVYGGRAEPKEGWRAFTPVKVQGVSGVVQVSCGAGHVLALTGEGRVMSWGVLRVNKVYSDEPRRMPAFVEGLDGVAAVVATGVSAVLKKDGTVWVWGNNEQAQFGNGKRDEGDFSAVPVRVPGLTNVAALAGAQIGRHFLALLKDGTVRGWGNTDWGQLGVGISGTAVLSVVTPKIAGVRALFAAGNNSFALKTDGTLWIWGIGSSYRGVWPLQTNAKLPLRFEIPQGVATP